MDRSAWERSVSVQLLPSMSVHFQGGESRLGHGPKRPSRNHRAPAACDEPPSPQNVPFDDSLHSSIIIAPFNGDFFSPVDDGRNFTAGGAGAFAIDGDDRVSEMDPIDRAGQVGGDERTLPENSVNKNAEVTKGRTEFRDAARGKMGSHRPRCHQRA